MKAPPNRIWKTGDRVIINNGAIQRNSEGHIISGCMVIGVVLVASSNGVSLILAFDGPLWANDSGAYLGMMPVLWTGEYFEDLVTRTRVDLEEAD